MSYVRLPSCAIEHVFKVGFGLGVVGWNTDIDKITVVGKTEQVPLADLFFENLRFEGESCGPSNMFLKSVSALA